ncbi:MAG TPA: MBL fold metallo-hydrolase [Burkholderiales bacterium]|nr:MBL fold metallo-hydrolase [Burkholderiales bacterium]
MSSPSAIKLPAAEPAALEFPWPAPVEPGQVQQVAEGVYWLRMPLPFALNHINLWLLRDGEGWAAVDCGIGLGETRTWWERILADVVGPAGLARVIVTHFHPDHFGNAAWLTQKFGAPLWMTETEYLTATAQYRQLPGFGSDASAALFSAHGLDAGRTAAVSGRGNSYAKIVGEPPLQFTRMLDGDSLEIGANRWRVITGYGHSPEHAALHCESLGVLISGDMLLPKISTNISVWPNKPESDPLKLFLRSIDRFSELPPDTLVLPSHGLPFRGAHLRVRALHEHHRDRLTEVIEACSRPSTAADLLPVLFRRELDTHQVFFAMGESIAHLNYLWLQGKLARTQGSDGVYRFSGRPA